MRPLLRGLLPLLVLALAGCGNGTLGDIWHALPEDAFKPPGDDGGGGGGGGGGGITLTEVGALAGGQGVTGTVKNIALATVAGETFAFLAAGPDGCHVVDVTSPDLINTSSYVTTIRNSVLTAPAEIAGGRIDAVAVVDGTYLVCIAVSPTSANCVTVFHLPTLIPAATSPAADLSAAFVPPATATDAVTVTGDPLGKGGGVSGAAARFFVATGTALTDCAVPGPAGWSVITPAMNLGTTGFETVTDVAVNQTTAIYASGKRTDGKFGFAVLANPAIPLPQPPTFIEVMGTIQSVVDSTISDPGNYPLDLAIDTLNLYVTGNNEVFVYNATNPFLPAVATTVTSTGSKTIAVSGSGGIFALGVGDAVRAGTNLLGQARVSGSLTFPGTYTIRGVAVRSTSEGVFLLVCAGTGGLRVVEVPRVS